MTTGQYGMNMGNQQFSMRNLTFHDAVIAVSFALPYGITTLAHVPANLLLPSQ